MNKISDSDIMKHFLGVAVRVRISSRFTLIGHIEGYSDLFLLFKTKGEISLLSWSNINCIKVGYSD